MNAVKQKKLDLSNIRNSKTFNKQKMFCPFKFLTLTYNVYNVLFSWNTNDPTKWILILILYLLFEYLFIRQVISKLEGREVTKKNANELLVFQYKWEDDQLEWKTYRCWWTFFSFVFSIPMYMPLAGQGLSGIWWKQIFFRITKNSNIIQRTHKNVNEFFFL